MSETVLRKPEISGKKVHTPGATLNNPYFDLIQRFSAEKSEPPATPEEAEQRILAAVVIYEDFAPPEVHLPDTPKPTLKDLLNERERQYWMEHGEIRLNGEFLTSVGYDTTLQANALRLIANVPHDVPDSVLNWGLAKTFLAGRIWNKVLEAAPFIRGNNPPLDLDNVLDPDYRSAILGISSGRARIEIHDGAPTIRAHNFDTAGRELAHEIFSRHDAWKEKHRLLTRSRKLRKILPFLVDVVTSARSPNQLWDAFQFHALQNYRERGLAAQSLM